MLIAALIFAATSSIQIIPIVASIATLIGVFIALIRLKPETENLTASASKTAVEVFNATVKSLQDDLTIAKRDIIEHERKLNRVVDDGERTIVGLKAERDKALLEASLLKAKVSRLENTILDLRLENDTPTK